MRGVDEGIEYRTNPASIVSPAFGSWTVLITFHSVPSLEMEVVKSEPRRSILYQRQSPPTLPEGWLPAPLIIVLSQWRVCLFAEPMTAENGIAEPPSGSPGR